MLRPTQNPEGYGYAADRSGVEDVTRSAEVIVPLVIERFAPKSVLDFGCGTGDWLAEFARRGVERVLGYDGRWIPRRALKLPQENFHSIDFYAAFPGPVRVDLAMCLEVAEHVAEPIGERILDHLCGCSDLVLWSAAVPGQQGYQHINSHFPEYWIEQFGRRGFRVFDMIRPAIWHDRRVSWWYRQNVFVFASEAGQQAHSLHEQPFIASAIHPALYEITRNPRHYTWGQMLAHVAGFVGYRVRRRLGLANDDE